MADARQEAINQDAQYKAELEEKDASMNNKLSREIDRTNLAEQQMQTVKEKFSKKITQIDHEGRMAKLRHDEFLLATKSEAMESITKAENGVPVTIICVHPSSLLVYCLLMRICHDNPPRIYV